MSDGCNAIARQQAVELFLQALSSITQPAAAKNFTQLSTVKSIKCRTYDRQIVGSTTPGQVAIEWLLLGWVTRTSKLFLYIINTEVNSAFHPFRADKSSTAVPGCG